MAYESVSLSVYQSIQSVSQSNPMCNTTQVQSVMIDESMNKMNQ